MYLFKKSVKMKIMVNSGHFFIPIEMSGEKVFWLTWIHPYQKKRMVLDRRKGK